MHYILLKIKENNYRLLSVILLLLSTMSIASALFFEYGLGHKPCILCTYQRVPFYIIILCSIAAYLLRRKFFLYLIVASFLCGFMIASYHVGVEHKYFDAPASCTSHEIPDSVTTAEQMRKYLETEETPSCDKPTYLIGHISMAELNALFCLIMGIGVFYCLRKNIRE